MSALSAAVLLIATPIAAARSFNKRKQAQRRSSAVRTRVTVQRAERIEFRDTSRRTTERVQVRHSKNGSVQIDFR